MSVYLQNLTHGTQGLEFGYALALAALLAGLIRARAATVKLLLAPLLAVPVMIVASILTSLVNLLVPGFGSNDVGMLQFALRGMLFVVLSYGAGRVLAAQRPAVPATHRRGAIVSTAPASSTRSGASITLAGVQIAPEDETKHFKFIGTTGTGKSTAIREILSAALTRGDRLIIADPDGGYLNRFFDAARGDVILNPFDGEARKWDIFGEINNDYDVEQLARSLIPDRGDSDRVWGEYARTFFSCVVRQAIETGNRDDAELYRLITRAPAEELRQMLAGTPAGPFLEPGNEKMFGSVRSIASSAVSTLHYTTRQVATPLSVRQWVRQGAAQSEGGRGGVLFFPYKAGEIAALRSVISAWMRIAIFEAMDRDEGDQHLWFVIDELDALGEIDGLKDALTRLRKFGGRCILGLQSIAQIAGLYGKGVAETIVENCGNTLILRCSASEHGGTSEFASKLIGQREVVHTTLSKSRRPSEWLASTTSSEHVRIEPAVMASEIERLADLAGFLKLASIPDWQAVKLTLVSEPVSIRVRKPSIVANPAPSAAKAIAAPKGARQRKGASRRTQAKAPEIMGRVDATTAATSRPGEAQTGN